MFGWVTSHFATRSEQSGRTETASPALVTRLAVWFASERRGSGTSKWSLGQTDGVLPDYVVTGCRLSNSRARGPERWATDA
jgi:hypothetical protein